MIATTAIARLRAAWSAIRHGPDKYAVRLLRERDEARRTLDALVRAVLVEPADDAKDLAVSALERGAAGGTLSTWRAARAFRGRTVEIDDPEISRPTKPDRKS